MKSDERVTGMREQSAATPGERHSRTRKMIFAAHACVPSRYAHSQQIMNMCAAFASQGFAVTLLAARCQEPSGVGADPWAWYGVERNFKLELLPARDVSHLARYLPKAARQFWRRTAWRLSVLDFTLRLILRIRKEWPDMVYSRDAVILWALSHALPGISGRCFFEAHTLPASALSRWIHRSLARKTGGMVALTSCLLERLRRIKAVSKHVVVAHDGVDLSRFELPERQDGARARLDMPEDDFLVGYVGQAETLGQDKGLALLAESVARIAGREPGIRLALVGPAVEELAGIRQILRDHGLPADLLLTPGWVNPGEIPLYLKAFSVCVLPLPAAPHFACAASPLKLFEYMASGTPLIASQLPATEEVLSDGEHAILVAPGSVEALEGALQRVRHDPALGQRLGAAAARAVQQFTWERRAQHILSMIDAAST